MLIDEIIVDAYGDDEQLMGFDSWFEETLALPVHASLIGIDVEVTEIAYRGDDRRGLIATANRAGHEAMIALVELCFEDLDTDSEQLMVAYRRWHGAPRV